MTANASPSSPEPRTLGQAVMDVRYAIEYGDLHERLWSHVDTALNFVQVMAGALALAGAFAPGTWLTVAAGLILAVVSGSQIAIKPRERSIAFRDARKAFADLDRQAWGLTLAEVDARLADIRRDAPRGFDLLTRPAENRTLASNGFESEVRPLRRSERLIMMFV